MIKGADNEAMLLQQNCTMSTSWWLIEKFVK